MEGSVLGNLWKGGFSFIQAFALSHPEYCCPWAGGWASEHRSASEGEPCSHRACPQPRTVPGGTDRPLGSRKAEGAALVETRRPGGRASLRWGLPTLRPLVLSVGHSEHSAAPTLLPPGVLGAGVQTPRL